MTQTILPQKWVIVEDGSVDRTNEIVTDYARRFTCIQLVSGEPTSNRNFGSKARAIAEGHERLKGLEYEFIGNLDADVSFEPTYYESVLAQFRDNPKLGIAGGLLFENCRGKWIRQFTSGSWSVSGPIQMFRKRCYEDIGGYMPLPVGGIDTVAEVMARMRGWEVKSFPNLKVLHHRRSGTQTENVLRARFRSGIREYSIGYHPLFHIAKIVYRSKESPYMVGSLFRFIGFIYAFLSRERRMVPNNFVNYLRQEQHERLYSFVLKKKKVEAEEIRTCSKAK
jgi:glycosyltransferase involved in cell wall biosynthesis